MGECEKALNTDEPWHFFTTLAEIDALNVLLAETTPNAATQQQMQHSLQTASKHSARIAPRLAAWLLPCSDCAAAISHVLPLPNPVKYWIKLLASHAHTVRNWSEATASDKWAVLKHSGSLRQDGDLAELLSVLGIEDPQYTTVIRAMQACHALDIQSLQQQGFSGNELGQAIKQAQIALLSW
ncbi:hypothetical protein [Suttonella sp. R2A3]|uniref:hypothetical protein n=1 Tax=Suttonella sp. R2A3 TaxID=2908648 RepID=UPI00288085F7|nr:hypothetical protein [Suttonella sp. R2A3]